VVHFDTEAVRPDTAWVRGVNAHLPSAVAVRWACQIGEDFHARFSARARSYRYLLLNRPVRAALLHDRVGWFHGSLDVDAMRSAIGCLLGEHDFSAFRAAECQAKSPVKSMQSVSIRRESDLIIFEFTANAFLHHMVRNLVGALVFIGKGRERPAWMADLLASRDRRQAAPTFDAAGLYFLGPEYDSEWRLPDPGRMMASSFILPV
jgi:tRNA pseudouridine38-40 synthase